jgi:HK97 family phage major capsid protein/HK97 family phage prohead protease
MRSAFLRSAIVEAVSDASKRKQRISNPVGLGRCGRREEASRRAGESLSLRRLIQPHDMSAEIRYRSATLSRQNVDESERIIRNVSVSSNEPYERFYGVEILLHNPENIDLDRIQKSASPLLFNHDRDALIGKVSNPRLKDGKLYVDLKFSQSELGRQMLADVKDGILTECSIGYEVNKFEVDDDEETYTATRWTLYECSLVSIPADYSVGVGRAKTQQQERPHIMQTQTRTDEDRLTETQRERHDRHIRELAIHLAKSPTFQNRGVAYDLEAERFISEKKTLAEFQDHCCKEAFKDVRPIQTPFESEPGEWLRNQVNGGGRGMSNRMSFNGGGGATIGERLFAHSDFKSFLKRSGKKYCSVEFPDVTNLRAALMTRLTLGGSGFQMIQQTGQIVPQPDQRLTIADLCSQAMTSAGIVKYLFEPSHTNTAGAVAEGGLKPEVEVLLQEASMDVRKLAGYVTVSMEMLDDVPASEAFIDSRLLYDVQEREELQLLNGDGLAPNLKGFLSTAGIQTQAFSTNIADTLRKAMTLIQKAKLIPSGIVISPDDFEVLSLLKDGEDRYLLSNVFTLTEMGNYLQTPGIWGLPLVVTTAMTPGIALVASFRQSCWIWRRSGVTIQASNQHADNFTRNLVTILAEERLTNAVVLPAGLVEAHVAA